jgi:hypothetical protein
MVCCAERWCPVGLSRWMVSALLPIGLVAMDNAKAKKSFFMFVGF